MSDDKKAAAAKKRRRMDNYQTPPALARAMTKRVFDLVGWSTYTHVVEPSAGVGNFVRAYRELGGNARVTAIEPRKQAFLKIPSGPNIRAYNSKLEDWTLNTLTPTIAIGNPPYRHAQGHIQQLKRVCDHVAFLLRMSFLGSQERANTLWKHPSGLRWLIPLAERPSFVHGKTDNSEYAVFIWQRFYGGFAEVLPHLYWRKS